MILAVLLGAGAGFAAEQPVPPVPPVPPVAPVPPAPWHVKDAEIRVLVTVAVKDALLRMPPQVYLADLQPLATTEGLAFDPKTKAAIRQDLRKPEEKAKTIAQQEGLFKQQGKVWDPKFYYNVGEGDGGPILRASGSATYAIKPEYQWFSWRAKDGPKVFIDGEAVPEEKIHRWDQAKNHSRVEAAMARLVAIPPGAKTLRIESGGQRLHQAGFITRSPAVANAILCLSGRDPSGLIPIVHRRSGGQVGCRVVWAEARKPMSILFDCSSGDAEYLVYLVDRARNPQRLDWVPEAELVEELRFPDRYDPALETLDGWQKVWDGAAVAGKGVPAEERWTTAAQPKPARVIYRGTLPIESTDADRLDYMQLIANPPPWLSRTTGYFHIPATGSYRFLCTIRPAGYLLFDGQMIVNFRGENSWRMFDLELEKGPHRLDLRRYGPAGAGGHIALYWKQPVKTESGNYERDWLKFGEMEVHSVGEPYMAVWEPMADGMAGPMEGREPALVASFTWNQYANLLGYYPAHDLAWYHFTAHVSGSPEGAVYRWRFGDGLTAEFKPQADGGVKEWRYGGGLTAEGERVLHLYLSPGAKKVQLEVLSGPGGNVIARAEGEIHVQMVLPVGRTHMMHQPNLLLMIWDCAEEEVLKQLPLRDLASLYYWSYPVIRWNYANDLLSRHHMERKTWARPRFADALAKRVDELIEAYPYSQLLQTAQGFSDPAHGPTAARHDAAEKLLKAVLQGAPAGSLHWRTAVSALADHYLSVRGKPDEAYALLAKREATAPAADLNHRWEMAKARQYHRLTDTDKLGELTAGLDWSPVTRPRDDFWKKAIGLRYENNLAYWIANQFDLPADWQGKQLVYHVDPNTGLPWAHHKHVWINGEPLGRMAQWLDGNIVIPASNLKKGATNRITWLLQLNPYEYQAEYAGSVMSADLKRRAWAVEQRVRCMDLETGKRQDSELLMMLGMLPNTPLSLAIARDGARYASGHQYGEVMLWDFEKGGKLQNSIGVGSVGIVSLAYSPDGRILAAGSEDSRITLLDAATGQTVRSLAGHKSEVFALAFSPDGKRLASGSFDKTVKVWDVAGGSELLTLTGHAEAVHAVAFSPDGKSLASAIDKTQIRISDAAGGKQLRVLSDQPGEVLALAFSPDGKRLASGSSEKAVGLWDLESGKKVPLIQREKTPPMPDGPVTYVQFSPDSKQLVSLGGSIGCFWNVGTGQQEREMTGLEGYMRVPEARWCGLYPMAKGFEGYPVALYTTEACDENGVNYACYDGKWDKLPDFDKLEPVKTGKLKHVDNEHLQEVLLRHKVVAEDSQVRWEIRPSGLKLTCYIKVEKAGDYEFTLNSWGGSRLHAGSQLVIDNGEVQDRETAARQPPKRGAVRLEPGVHRLELVYFHVDQNRFLNLTFPVQFVRDLAMIEVEERTALGKALWLCGKKAEAKRLLMNLERDGWPMDESEHSQLSGTLRSVRYGANYGREDSDAAFEVLTDWERRHPMLVITPDYLTAKAAAFGRAGDYLCGLTLCGQLSESGLNGQQEQEVLLRRVKLSIQAGQMDGARETYQKLKAIAPASPATTEAREAITNAVRGKKVE
jgi:WD40 repeat protein